MAKTITRAQVPDLAVKPMPLWLSTLTAILYLGTLLFAGWLGHLFRGQY